MSHHSPHSASPLDGHDQEPSRAPKSHRPEPESGAAVHTESHHSQSSEDGAEIGENPCDTGSGWPQIKGVDPFTRTAPLYERRQAERDARRCDDAHQIAPLKMFDELPENQQKAIGLLISGKAYTHIAKRLGIDRSTLWRWRNRDNDFRRALEAAREEAYRDADNRLRELVPRAIEILESHLDNDDYQTAVRVLRLARIDGQQALRSFESRPFFLGGP